MVFGYFQNYLKNFFRKSMIRFCTVKQFFPFPSHFSQSPHPWVSPHANLNNKFIESKWIFQHTNSEIIGFISKQYWSEYSHKLTLLAVHLNRAKEICNKKLCWLRWSGAYYREKSFSQEVIRKNAANYSN